MSRNFLSDTLGNILGRRGSPGPNEDENTEAEAPNTEGAAAEGGETSQIEVNDTENQEGTEQESFTESESEADEAADLSKSSSSLDSAAAFDAELKRRTISALEKYKDALAVEPCEHPLVPKPQKKVTIKEDKTTGDKVGELRKEVGRIGGVYVTKTRGTERTSVSALDQNDTTMGMADPTLQLPDAHDSTRMGGFHPRYISTPAKALIADRNKGRVEHLSPVTEEAENTPEKEGEKRRLKILRNVQHPTS